MIIPINLAHEQTAKTLMSTTRESVYTQPRKSTYLDGKSAGTIDALAALNVSSQQGLIILSEVHAGAFFY